MAIARPVLKRHFATLVALLVVLACVAFFFHSRRQSRPLEEVAEQLGLRVEDIAAMAPRISSQTGATLGTSRRVLYLMACSGVPTRNDLEAQATRAADIAERQRLTPRQAATSVLSSIASIDSDVALRNC